MTQQEENENIKILSGTASPTYFTMAELEVLQKIQESMKSMQESMQTQFEAMVSCLERIDKKLLP